MNIVRTTLFASFIALFVAATSVQAATTVTVNKMHLCCGLCVKGVTAAVGKVDGASLEVNRKKNSIAITADDEATVQKALDAVAAAGFHGVTDNDKLAIKNDSGVEKGKVTRLELVGVHNCCGGCNKAVKKAIASVDGVVADTAKPKQDSIVIEGNFDGESLVTALFKAGFHVKAKK